MMEEERLQILRMVEEHKLTAEEAAKLLSALESQTAPATEPATREPARWLRVRVTDNFTGKTKVNVNVPMGVVTAAGKLGSWFGLSKYGDKEGIDVDGIIKAIQTGAEGKIVDVDDEQGGEHVEVYVE